MVKNKKATVTKRAPKPQTTLDTHVVRKTRASKALQAEKEDADYDENMSESSESRASSNPTSSMSNGQTEEDCKMKFNN